MHTRVACAVALVSLASAGAVYVASASGKTHIPSCTDVRVSGGNFNGLTGGVIVAGLVVRNVSHHDCAVATRPWIRLGPVRHSVTVADAPPGLFGSPYSTPQGRVTLSPGQRTVTQIYVGPGSCDHARWHVFSLSARAGWANHSVAIGDVVCKDGTGTIWVGSFHR